MTGRKTSSTIFLTLLALLLSTFVFTPHSFAQNPTGREAPRAVKKEPAPPKKEKSKSAASPSRSAGPSRSASSTKTSNSVKAADTVKTASSTKTNRSGKSGKTGTVRAPIGKTTLVNAKLTLVAPAGASVEVDGKPRGVIGPDGNLVLSGLAPGDHQVLVSAAGYELWRDTFVMSTASTRFEVPLRKKPATGRLELTSNEAGTEILIDEKYGVKTLPGQVTRVDGLFPGVRQLRAIKPGFREWRGSVTVKAEDTVAVSIVLIPILDPQMIRIPEGQFLRGNDKGARDQRPSHQVFTTAFEISRSEVSNRLYKYFIDATNRPAPRGVGFGWDRRQLPSRTRRSTCRLRFVGRRHGLLQMALGTDRPKLSPAY